MNPIESLTLISILKARPYHMSGERLRRHQRKMLARSLSYAVQHSAYYAAYRGKRRLTDFPVVAKDEMVKKFNVLNTAGLDASECAEFRIAQERGGGNALYRGSYSVGLSSGTKGARSVTVLSKRERERYGCLLAARSGIPSGLSERNILFCLRTNNPAFSQMDSFGVKLVFADYTTSVPELIDLINSRELNILAGPPTMLHLISKEVRSIRKPIDFLISYAEVLDDHVRADLEHAFGTRVSQIYQGSEGFIGFTCREGTLHINEDCIHCEFMDAGDPDGRVKRLVITDLYRRTQPVIRYAIDDLVELGVEPCGCGSVFRTIKKIHGRRDDLFILPGTDGTRKYLFPDYMRRSINQASDCVQEYQAIQRSETEIEIRLQLGAGCRCEEIRTRILDRLNEYVDQLGAVMPGIVFSDTPPAHNQVSGKMVRIVRDFPEDR